MSDTVPSAAIASSLGDAGPAFVCLPDDAAIDGALHVSGAAHAAFGSASLVVDFRSLAPDNSTPIWTGLEQSGPSVTGYASAMPDPSGVVIAGALQNNGG